MASLSVTELQRYVERVQQRLLSLERRFAPPQTNRGDSSARNFAYFRVTKPILPGRQGLAVQVSYNTLITSAPIDPLDPDQFWLSDEYQGWSEISSAEYEIHDFAHKTLAMVGDIIVAEYRYNKWRTFTEFGLANVRTRVLENVTYTTGPAVEARYQILIGDDEVPQVYEGFPVYVTRMVTESQTANMELLLSYDRTDQEWFEVKRDLLYRFTLLSDLSTGVALSTILTMEGDAVETKEVHDPLSIFIELEHGDKGICYYQNNKYWVIQAACPEVFSVPS